MKTISICMDDGEYASLVGMLDSMGQTIQTFYATYTKTALRLRKIPFTIEAPPEPVSSESDTEDSQPLSRQEDDGDDKDDEDDEENDMLIIRGYIDNSINDADLPF